MPKPVKAVRAWAVIEPDTNKIYLDMLFLDKSEASSIAAEEDEVISVLITPITKKK